MWNRGVRRCFCCLADLSKAVFLLLLIHCLLLLLLFVGGYVCFVMQLRNKFDFWKVYGIMNTSDLLQSK